MPVHSLRNCSKARLALTAMLLALTVRVSAQTTHTATSWAQVQTLHNNTAVNGDTIQLSAGAYTVTTGLTITKAITFRCAAGVTITDNSVNTTDLFLVTESTAASIRLENCTINQGTAQHSNPNGIVRVINTTGGQPVLVTGFTYNMASDTGDMFIWQSNRGVIWGNRQVAVVASSNCFNRASFVRHKWSGAGNWMSAETSGTANVLFIEANTLERVAEAIDVDDNARLVVRFNRIINGALVSHGADTSAIGSRQIEAYNNTWEHNGDWLTQNGCVASPQNVNFFISHRGGGRNFIFNNAIPHIPNQGFWGEKSEIAFWVENLRRNAGSYACWTGGYPSPYQFGWGYTTGGTQVGTTGVFMDIEPTYYFNNTGTGNYNAPQVSNYFPNECSGGAPDVSSYIQQNREYYLYTASFTGAAGVGSGLRASRPASTTNGVAYWSTNQGTNWNTTNGAGVDGCLDIVRNGAWVNCAYTPYTYPHPLATGGTVPETGTLTVIKTVVNDSGGSAAAGSFTINVTGSSPSPSSFAGSTTGVAVTVGTGTYSVTETAASGYTVSYSAGCSGTMTAGATVTCTVTNNDTTPTSGTVSVMTTVINDDGGSAIASNFSNTVAGTSPSPATFVGSVSGVSVSLGAGAYSVTQTPVSGYSTTYSASCSGTMTAGAVVSCTVTNDDIDSAPPPPPSGGNGINVNEIRLNGQTIASTATPLTLNTTFPALNLGNVVTLAGLNSLQTHPSGPTYSFHNGVSTFGRVGSGGNIFGGEIPVSAMTVASQGSNDLYLGAPVGRTVNFLNGSEATANFSASVSQFRNTLAVVGSTTSSGGGSDTVVYTDPFTGTNGDPLGSGWSVGDGGFHIASNRAEADQAQSNMAIRTSGTYANDQYAKVNLYAGGGSFINGHICLRCSVSPLRGYLFGVDTSSAQWSITKLNGAESFTVLQQGSLGGTSEGAQFHARVSGSTLTLYRDNGVGDVQLGTVNDISFTSGAPGIFAYLYAGAATTFDGFEAGNIGGGEEGPVTTSTTFSADTSGNVTMAGTTATVGAAWGATGWQCDVSGNCDFRYITADELAIDIFTANNTAVYRSGLLVTKSHSTLARPFNCPAYGANEDLFVLDNPALPDSRVFSVNDWVQVRVESWADSDNDGNQSLIVGYCVGYVDGYTDLAGGTDDGQQQWVFHRAASPDGGTLTGGTSMPAGSIVMDWGIAGQGGVEIKANEGPEGEYSPFVRSMVWGGTPAPANFVVRTQTGQLRGLCGNTTDLFGFFAGDCTGLHTQIDPTNGLRFFNNTTLYTHLGSGFLRLGPSDDENIYIDSNAIYFLNNGTTYGSLSGTTLNLGRVADGFSRIQIDSASGGVKLIARAGGVDATRIHLDNDGSGYLASGAISWSSSGLLTIDNGEVTWDSSGIRLTPGTNATWSNPVSYAWDVSNGYIGTRAFEDTSGRFVGLYGAYTGTNNSFIVNSGVYARWAGTGGGAVPAEGGITVDVGWNHSWITLTTSQNGVTNAGQIHLRGLPVFWGTTAGSAGSIAGYIDIQVGNTTYKIPYYNP